jgi:glycosyltransferase involved in cell wall biosynthesis
VRHGESAYLVAPDSRASLTEALARLVDDAELRRRLAEGALRAAQARRWDTIYDQLELDYRAVIAAKAKGMTRAA